MEYPKMVEPPLLRFLRQLGEKSTKEAFASACGVSLTYLYNLCNNSDPNVALRTAYTLVEQAQLFAHRHKIEPFGMQDLLVGRLDVPEPVLDDRSKDFITAYKGKVLRRRLDQFGRAVLIDKNDKLVMVEDSAPSAKMRSLLPIIDV